MDTQTLVAILKLQLQMLGLSNPSSGLGAVNIVLGTKDVVTELFSILGNIFSNILGLFSDLSQIIHILDFLPNAWVSLFLIMLGIVVSLRLYAYFSDVSIGGFKI